MTTIYNARGTQKIVPDNQFNTDYYWGTTGGAGTGIQLPGRNVTNYGGPIAQNFLQLTENFANITPPTNATIGQTWFNTADKSLYVRTDISTETPYANWSRIGSTVTMSSDSVNITTAGMGGTKTFGTEYMLGSLTVPRTGVVTVAANVTVSYATDGSGAFRGGFFMNLFLGTGALMTNPTVAGATWFSDLTSVVCGGPIMNTHLPVTAGQTITLGGAILNTNGLNGTWQIADSVYSANTAANACSFSYTYIA